MRLAGSNRDRAHGNHLEIQRIQVTVRGNHIEKIAAAVVAEDTNFPPAVSIRGGAVVEGIGFNIGQVGSMAIVGQKIPE